MEEVNKLPLKRVEHSLSKFNDVAIPHHLDLLRQHKANIIKYEEEAVYSRVRAEQTHAGRVAKQLRSLLSELEALRRQVRKEDLEKFDKLTQKSRELTLKAIVDYLDTSPLSINRAPPPRSVAHSALSTDSVGVVAHAGARGDDDVVPLALADDLLQLQIHDEIQQEASLAERESALRGWCSLQDEVRALHETWRALHTAAIEQRDSVAAAGSDVSVAADNVTSGTAALTSAERLKVASYGVGGAALGALVGGPLGLVVGAKAGAAALLAGSALGYLGARLLGRRRGEQLHEEEKARRGEQLDQNKKDKDE